MISSPFSPKGRVRRLHFFVAFIALNVFSKVMDRAVNEPGSSPWLYVFYALLAWPVITLMVQRAHDSGRNGKFVAMALGLLFGSAVALAFGAGIMGDRQDGSVLAILAAIILGVTFIAGFIMTMIVYFAPGDPETNEHGPNPRLRAPATNDIGIPNAPEDALIDLAARRGFNTGE